MLELPSKNLIDRLDALLAGPVTDVDAPALTVDMI